jgi:hypothetical protein
MPRLFLSAGRGATYGVIPWTNRRQQETLRPKRVVAQGIVGLSISQAIASVARHSSAARVSGAESARDETCLWRIAGKSLRSAATCFRRA